MKKKILFVISTLNTGGAQRAFSNIIMALPEEYDVSILLNDEEDIVYPYKGEIINLGLKPEKNKRKISYQLKVLFKRYFTLKKLKKEGRYIACISALESANFANILTGNKNCKCIISIRNYHDKKAEKSYIYYLMTYAIKLVYNRADKIVTVSEGIREMLIRNYRLDADKICTIYNGYDVEKIEKNAIQPVNYKELDFSKRIIVASGRLTEQKGFEHLINCFSVLERDFQDLRLVILGEGELRGKLEKQIQRLGLEDKIFLLGFKENPFSIISKCKIFVLSSLYEGYPNVLAEALICGVPCVACDCKTGPREILGSDEIKKNSYSFQMMEYGLLCQSFLENPNEAENMMEDALRELLTNDALYQYYKKQCEKKKKEMEMKNIVKQWLDVIDMDVN